MSELSFSQYQEAMKPFIDLVKGIIHIVGYDSPEEEQKKFDDIFSQITLSILTLHISDQAQQNNLNFDEFENLAKDNNQEELFKAFSGNVTQEQLDKYLENSISIVMTGYYIEVKNKITEEKTKQIQDLYNEISERK